jgi:predicted ferric reductase
MTGRSLVRQRFIENWIAIVLTVTSIIQGLALSRLADVLGKVHSVSQWAAFILAFIILLRVFQTYVAAALEYDEWPVGFMDLVVIFGLGLAQYQMIDKLGTKDFHSLSFETWVVLITSVALIGHSRAYRQVSNNTLRSRNDVERERRLQATNLSVAGICLTLAVLLVAIDKPSVVMFVSVSLSQAALITLNIYRSVTVTIHKPMQLAHREMLEEARTQQRDRA